MTPSTLIIVTAYNEAESLGTTLDALARAFPGASRWVADDGSSDATAQIARQGGAAVVRSERMIGKGGAATLAAQAVLERLAGEEPGGEARKWLGGAGGAGGAGGGGGGGGRAAR